MNMHRPNPLWQRPLQVSFAKLWPALGKGAIDAATLNWSATAKDVLEVVGAMGLKRDPSEIAWLLVHRSLLQAMLELTRSHQVLTQPDQPFDLTFLGRELDHALTNSDLAMNTHFFQKPEQLPLLNAVKPTYCRWLEAYGASAAVAKSMSDRLPSYFAIALNREWAAGKEPYTCLLEHLKTPFTSAYQREQKWTSYRAWLHQQVDEPLLTEAFSLRQIYIKPRAYYEQEEKEPSASKHPANRMSSRMVVDLETELQDWLQKADKKDAIRVISGGPGSGKSSFTKMFAAYCAELEHVRVLRIPLHQLDPMKELGDAIDRFIQNDPDQHLPPNPLKPEHTPSRLFLIFDGLDELTMQGQIAAEVAQQFVEKVERTVYNFNSNSAQARLQVLISGRELVIQANNNWWQRVGQILHILPYVEQLDLERPNRDQSNNLITYSYLDPQKLLLQDQRHLWWTRYGELTGRNYQGLPQELQRDKLTEITAQPLLNYLVALSFTQKRLNLAQSDTLNALYAGLLDSVYQRTWEQHQHPQLGGMSPDKFIRILEEISIACWHGDGRTTTVRDIEARYGERDNIQQIVGFFQEEKNFGVTRLLIAFYFRQSSIPGADKTFEFTHKSFGEYLTATRIVRELDLMQDEWTRYQDNPDRGWNASKCLEQWAKLCGPTEMDVYLLDFIRAEVAARSPEIVLRWQKMLCHLISVMLRQGMPMEKLGLLTYQEMTRQARNAEESLLALLNACAESTTHLSEIQWPTSETLGFWLSKLQGQRLGEEYALSLKCLSYLDLQSVTLSFRDLRSAHLNHANLRGSNLQGAILMRAHLEGTNLEKTNLQGANLQAADLRGANLQAADLRNADLREADLHEAHQQEANLEGARFH